MLLAHRHSYTLLVGPIPADKQLDHVFERGCVSRLCVNPAHLEPVTHAVNAARGERVRKTHCPADHEYTEANTYVWNNQRHCRECQRIRQRKRRS